MPSKARKLGREAWRLADAMRRWRTSPAAALRRYLALYRGRRFSPDEIHFFGLLDPTLTDRDLDRYASKEELLAVQRRLNAPELHRLTEDKLCFHRHCVAAGLAVPRLLALWDPDRADRNDRGDDGADGVAVLSTVGALDAMLRTAPSVVIVKPLDGVHGEGVTRLARDGAAWRDSRGSAVDATTLHATLTRSTYRRWIVQDFVRGHPALAALSATDALQTVRVVTLATGGKGGDGDVEILAARLRLICGRAAHDNFDYGRGGNLIAILDPASGVVRHVVGGAADRLEIRRYTHHPVTKAELPGFTVPEWDAVRQLVQAAARAFAPLVTIGWDVAITPGAPCLIEGNVTWDTLSGDPAMGDIYRRLARLATPASAGPAAAD